MMRGLAPAGSGLNAAAAAGNHFQRPAGQADGSLQNEGISAAVAGADRVDVQVAAPRRGAQDRQPGHVKMQRQGRVTPVVLKRNLFDRRNWC